VQEETTALGVTCLTLRDTTERPITVERGTNVLVGRDPERIVAVALEVLRNPPAKPASPLWDGRAGARIAERLLDRISRPGAPRPTDLASLDLVPGGSALPSAAG
jgi:UDP-N-acetylglucosamine 2-epimerase (non-hydrolysing)